jgi:hypothetical protein
MDWFTEYDKGYGFGEPSVWMVMVKLDYMHTQSLVIVAGFKINS